MTSTRIRFKDLSWVIQLAVLVSLFQAFLMVFGFILGYMGFV